MTPHQLHELQKLLISFGCDVSANVLAAFIWDGLKRVKNMTREQLSEKITKSAKINNKEDIDEIINVMAKEGIIIISGAEIYAGTIILQSAKGGKFQVNENSSLKTDKAFINVGRGGSICGSGGSCIKISKKGKNVNTAPPKNSK